MERKASTRAVPEEELNAVERSPELLHELQRTGAREPLTDDLQGRQPLAS
jgi:hypothetical protein